MSSTTSFSPSTDNSFLSQTNPAPHRRGVFHARAQRTLIIWYNGRVDHGDAHQSVVYARRRALTALALFAFGAYVAQHLVQHELQHMSTVALGLAGLSVAAGVVVRGRARTCMLACSVLLIGMGWAMLRLDPDRPGRVGTMVRALSPHGQDMRGRVPIEVRGVVTQASRTVHRIPGLADPPMWPASVNQAELDVTGLLVHRSATRAEWQSSGGTLRLLLAPEISLRAGERVELLGRYLPVQPRSNPGEAPWRMLAAQRGDEGTLIVEHADHITPSQPGGLLVRSHDALLGLRATIRDRALRSIGIDESRPSDARSATRAALLLGERDPRFDEVYSRFQRVGVAHVLAISGFHLALVVMMCTLAVRLSGEHPRLETAVAVAILIGVLVLIPLRPPIARASVILAALLLANRFGRRYDRMTVLAWVGLGLLVWRPMDTTSLGYQLSMGITALLVALSQVRTIRLLELHTGARMLPQQRSRWRAFLGWFGELLRVHFACWLVALPIISYHAGVVGLLAPLASIVLVPLIALMMALGYAQVLLGIFAPALAKRTMWLIEAPSAWVLDLIAWFDGFVFSWAHVPRVGALWALVATVVLAGVVTRALRLRRAATLVALLLVIGWGIAQPVLSRPSARVRVVMIDVGDGSCVVVQSGNAALVWDCGSLDRRVGAPVARALRAMGVSRLEGVIVTHDNLDHYNALPDLAEVYEIPVVSITARLDQQPSAAWSRVRHDLEARGVRFEIICDGDSVRIGRASIEILWPSEPIPDGLDDNDTSIVALIGVPGEAHRGILLTGDIEGDAMDRIRALYPELPQALGGGAIEMPHHGSARDEAYAFIDWVDPGVIMQSTGPERLDDARWDAQRRGRDWYTTARGGAIVIELDQDGTLTHRSWFGGW